MTGGALRSDNVDALTAAFSSCAMAPSTGRDLLFMRGAESLDLLNRISTNALADLAPGEVRTTLFTTDKGRIVDLVHVVPRQDGAFLVASPGAGAALREWISRFIIMEDIVIEFPPVPYTVGTLVGPQAIAAAGNVWGIEIRQGHAVELRMSGGTATALAVTEFGTDWVYLVIPQAGLEHDGRPKPDIPVLDPVSMEAMRVLRGMPAYGKEIREQFNPYDIGLTFAVSYSKGCYVGQEVIARLDTYNKAQKHLLGLHVPESLYAHSPGTAIRKGGEEVGVVTSIAEIGRHWVGLGVVSREIGPEARLALSDAGGTPTCTTFQPPATAELLRTLKIPD
jgi:folate-binding protein YgfZ